MSEYPDDAAIFRVSKRYCPDCAKLAVEGYPEGCLADESGIWFRVGPNCKGNWGVVDRADLVPLTTVAQDMLGGVGDK